MASYVKDHGIDELFRTLAAELEGKKPKDPLQYLMQRIPSFQTSAVQPRSGGAKPEHHYPEVLNGKALTIVVMGASGDLAKKKTYPALFSLYGHGLLPEHTTIVGFARSHMDRQSFLDKISSAFRRDYAHLTDHFFNMCDYVSGQYDDENSFRKLNDVLLSKESRRGGPAANRVYYFALPPSIFVDVSRCIARQAMSQTGWNRMIVEKPFGHDLDSSNKLAQDLGELFTEDQIYRIDHYLGKEMVQNLVTLRFANKVFSEVWNADHIANVQIVFKEPFGVEGRAGYFDSFGIVRDIIQNHLLQVLSLTAMEKPKTLDSESVRDEKVHVLQCIGPVEISDVVLGQYVRGDNGQGTTYLDDDGVPANSKTPTFAQMVLWINNDRWRGVPFIMKAGKALNERKAEVRIQFRDEILPYKGEAEANELVIRVQPKEAIYMKMNAKLPGLNESLTGTELDLSYHSRYDDLDLPDAYEGLIYDVMCGKQSQFVRTDELEAAWKIFTPILHSMAAGRVPLLPYKYGSRGPREADEMVARMGYKRSTKYVWTRHN